MPDPSLRHSTPVPTPHVETVDVGEVYGVYLGQVGTYLAELTDEVPLITRNKLNRDPHLVILALITLVTVTL